MLRRSVPLLFLTALSLVFAFAVAEAFLRARPGSISREVLLEFDRSLRSRIADRLGLSLERARRCLTPEARGDRGPKLCLVAPGAEIFQEADPEDRALGALERLPHDARGFCNSAADAERPRADVVAIGDSFTWCTAVAADRAWPAVLAARTGLAVYNLGVPGVGVHEYVEVFERFGLPLEPRVVVVGVYGGNDLRDAGRFAERRASGERARRQEHAGMHSAAMRHSFPSAHAAYAPAVRFSDPQIGAQVTAFDKAQRRALPGLSARHGMAFVDCTPFLNGAVVSADLAYFPGNLHPTAAGHALFASCVEPAVTTALARAANR